MASDNYLPGRTEIDTEPAADNVEISVVVPAYFGASTIEACLRSVQRASLGRRVEILVVESSGDETRDVVNRSFPDVRLVASTHRLTAGGARNRGMSEARGRLTFFVDQDCVVPEDWIDRLESYLQDPSVGAAGGSVGIQDPSNLSGAAVYFLEFLNHFPGRSAAQRNRNFLIGCNCVCRSEVVRAVRFPDQTLAEDVLFSHAIRERGLAVVYDASIEVCHRNRTGWGEFFRYNRKMGQSAATAHQQLSRDWTRPFLRFPTLAFLAPFAILPSIALRLLRQRPSYLVLFLAVSPMCLLGNIAWAAAFRRAVLDRRSAERLRA